MLAGARYASFDLPRANRARAALRPLWQKRNTRSTCVYLLKHETAPLPEFCAFLAFFMRGAADAIRAYANLGTLSILLPVPGSSGICDRSKIGFLHASFSRHQNPPIREFPGARPDKGALPCDESFIAPPSN
ncbi:hypothetical protein N7492_010169 [Penicillium capsulatum]|uniref:Uncharacterized protein n=1 Tax=Penicillium capsulatum TaxID=69766 RepID=A0A9W9HQN4_9EURO|nr:hypothetical protein N7492_010169 [Penicillium capsulatum]KAJ6112677.1 hypothetical protein N7512_008001 [Penicillium capsulatum]